MRQFQVDAAGIDPDPEYHAWRAPMAVLWRKHWLDLSANQQEKLWGSIRKTFA
jgi:hypothetical protein